VFTVEIATGGVVDITPDTMRYQQPDWSLSIDRLVAVGVTPWEYGIFILGADGVPIRAVSLGAAGFIYRGPVWSPNQQIAWEQVDGHGSEIWVADLSTGDYTHVATGFVGVSWSRDGSELIYSSSTPAGARLFALNLATKRSRQITP
jgi:Tol biopolymer transport system component